MNTEIWKDIEENPNYQVSNHGRVKNKHTDRILKPRGAVNDYKQVCLYKDGIGVNRRVHRLVAKAFIPNYAEELQVNHIDGNKSNNYLDNLEWVTRLENMKHAYDNGLISHRSPMSGQRPKPVRIIETGEVFESENACARAINGNRRNVQQCLKGKRHTHLGYRFEYA